MKLTFHVKNKKEQYILSFSTRVLKHVNVTTFVQHQRNSRSEVFYEKGVLKNFPNFPKLFRGPILFNTREGYFWY